METKEKQLKAKCAACEHLHECPEPEYVGVTPKIKGTTDMLLEALRQLTSFEKNRSLVRALLADALKDAQAGVSAAPREMILPGGAKVTVKTLPNKGVSASIQDPIIPGREPRVARADYDIKGMRIKE